MGVLVGHSVNVTLIVNKAGGLVVVAVVTADTSISDNTTVAEWLLLFLLL